MTGLMAYDPVRLDTLRIGLIDALDDLHRIRSDDPAAADATRAAREACRVLGDRWLPRVRDIVESDAMVARRPSSLSECGLRTSVFADLVSQRHWSLITDPLDASTDSLRLPAPLLGPDQPWARSFDDVMTDIDCGKLVPLALPSTASGGAHVTTISIAPMHVELIDTANVTPNIMRLIGFFSDALPIGHHQLDERAIYYVTNATVTTSMRAIDARSGASAALPGQTARAVASGFLVVSTTTESTEIHPPLAPKGSDPTQDPSIKLQASSSYSGIFYPISSASFSPVDDQEPDEEEAAQPVQWSFTSVDGTALDDLLSTWSR